MALPLPRVVADVEPGGGLITAMQGMNSLSSNMLKTKMQQLENQYYAPNKESEIGYRNALKNSQDINNKYLPQELQLKNAFQQLQNQYYAPNMQSEVNNRNALTNKYNMMTPLEAQQLKLQNQFYPQVTQSNIDAQKAMANWHNMGGGMGEGQGELMGLQQQVAKDNPNFTPKQVNQAASAYLDGNKVFPDGTPLPPISGISKSFVDQIIKKGTTAQGLNQQRFANTTDAILDKGSELIPAVSKYAGLLGKSQGGIDAVESSLGANTPEYQEYMYFTRTFVPYAAGEMMRALGVNASDTQKNLYQKVINPISWDQNPKSAIENYNKMKNLFKDTVSKTVSKSTSEIRSSLRGKSSGIAEVRYNRETGEMEGIK